MAKRPKSNNKENSLVRALDNLAAFEEFQDSIAPALRGAVKAGKSPEEIYRLVLSHASARMATIALTSKKPAEALSALKDILDRTSGKATENKNVKVSMQDAPDEQLDARLKTLMGAEIDDDEETLQ